VEKKSVPFKKTLFVCTNSRAEGERVSCGASGLALFTKLKEEAAKAGLKGKVRVSKSGCLDVCEQGPNAFCYPENEWFSKLTEADVPALLKKLAE
jgi:(2Fe-2S) ferredoxin